MFSFLRTASVLTILVLTQLLLSRGWAELALNGIRNIGFWAFIWAPGIALVRCIMRSHRERHPDAPA